MLAKWHVRPGDKVSAGDVIAEIETDKAVMEVEAIDDGVVARLFAAEGEKGVKIGAVIALLAEEGEDPSSLPDPGSTEPVDPTGPAAPLTEQATTEPVTAMETASPVARSEESGPVVRASPLARRLARERGIVLSGVRGSGPKGRIVARDLDAAVPAGRDAAASGLPSVLDERVYPPDSYDLVPLDGMGRIIAERLTASFMHIPHFPLNMSLRIDRLMEMRAVLNGVEGIRISVNDMLVKAAALALIQVPECNASYTDKGIARHKSAHVSVAVAVEGGLMTPVLRDANTLGLAEISTRMRALAEKARARKLAPHDYMGGSFSLSNLGMFGVESFGSILNPPEAMILSVGAGMKRPVIEDDGSFGSATMMSVTLTCDHRVVGGAQGARWLSVFRDLVVHPETMMLS